MHLCVCASLSVCIFLLLPSAMQQACGNSHLTSSPIPCCLFLCVADNVRRRCDSSWDEASPLIPPPHFPSFHPVLSVSTPGICLCAWFSSIGLLTWESQWHRCPQAKTRLDEQRHTFLPLPRFPDEYHLPVRGHISVYLLLEMLIGCLQ